MNTKGPIFRDYVETLRVKDKKSLSELRAEICRRNQSQEVRDWLLEAVDEAERTRDRKPEWEEA
jgi:hypothetical protein